MPGVKGNSGGKKGRSGRLPLTEELRRYQIRQKAWEVTGQFLDSKEELEKRANLAVGIVKADMSKPIVIDNSTHEHHTLKIDLNTADQPELVAALLGRVNGHAPKPQR